MVTLADFDGVTFRVSSDKTVLLVSISIKCFKELASYGAQVVLQREYGSLLTTPEQGYDVTLKLSPDQIKDKGLLTHVRCSD